jgi:ABC-type transport system involved in cytochrome c biogenesis ATPase subunit
MYVLLLLLSLYITGEKARVALAIFALVPRNLLLLDEVSLSICFCQHAYQHSFVLVCAV